MAFEFDTTEDVQGFLNSFVSPQDKAPEADKPATSTVQQALDSITNPKRDVEPKVVTEVEKPAEPGKTKEEIEAILNKQETEKKVEEDALLIRDVAKLAESLKEKGLLIPYEDGTLPTTEEEIFNALEQSTQFNANKTVEDAWKARVESLPPSLLRIHEYAAQGVTTAEQLSHFTNVVAQTEMVGSLDPKIPEDQEQIVLLQLMNTGLDEKSAREEVADLKSRNILEERAKRFFPTIKKAYDDSVMRLEIEQRERAENQARYVQTNAANVAYFLEKDTDYLPFKIDPRDRAYKAEIFNLAGQEVDRSEDGTPVFGWQKHLESLQYGTEEEYKKFMKIMAFIASDKKYEEGVGKKIEGKVKTNEFKKIGTSQGTNVNTLSSEAQPIQGIKKSAPNRQW